MSLLRIRWTMSVCLMAASCWLGFTTASCANSLKPFDIVSLEENRASVNRVMEFLAPMYKELGFEAKIHFEPSARSLVSANKGLYDADLARIAGIQFHFPNLVPVSEPLLKHNLSLVHHIEDKNLPLALEEISPADVAYALGVQFLERKYRGTEAFPIKDGKALVKMVARKRARFAIASTGQMEKFVDKESQVNVLDMPIAVIALYHYLHVDRRHLAEPLRKLFIEHNKRAGGLFETKTKN